jgi:hypothetical protein
VLGSVSFLLFAAIFTKFVVLGLLKIPDDRLIGERCLLIILSESSEGALAVLFLGGV